MAKIWIILWRNENDLYFLEAQKICTRNKQFLMPCHEDGWSYRLMFVNETGNN